MFLSMSGLVKLLLKILMKFLSSKIKISTLSRSRTLAYRVWFAVKQVKEEAEKEYQARSLETVTAEDDLLIWKRLRPV